nr:hypothetical protein [uncultured Methanobrevibacter sp.]
MIPAQAHAIAPPRLLAMLLVKIELINLLLSPLHQRPPPSVALLLEKVESVKVPLVPYQKTAPPYGPA